MDFTSSPEFKVLFLCMGNSARSILAESILNNIGAGHFVAYSAGSAPKGQVHPLTLRVLEEAQLPTAGLRSKSWDDLPPRARRSLTSYLPSATTWRGKAARSGRVTR